MLFVYSVLTESESSVCAVKDMFLLILGRKFIRFAILFILVGMAVGGLTSSSSDSSLVVVVSLSDPSSICALALVKTFKRSRTPGFFFFFFMRCLLLMTMRSFRSTRPISVSSSGISPFKNTFNFSLCCFCAWISSLKQHWYASMIIIFGKLKD